MRVPCLHVWRGKETRGSIDWEEHLAVHRVYVERNKEKYWFKLLSAARIAQMGGFGYAAVTDFLGHAPTTWEPDKP